MYIYTILKRKFTHKHTKTLTGCHHDLTMEILFQKIEIGLVDNACFFPFYFSSVWYVYRYMHIHAHMYMDVYMYTCIHMYIHTYMYTCIHTYIYTCTYIHVHVHIPIYVYTYTHIYMHTYKDKLQP